MFAQRILAPRIDFDRLICIPGTTPVAVALRNRLPRRDVDVVIQRRANTKPNDVILIRPRALEPELLAQAVETLRLHRRAFGRVPDGDAIIGVRRGPNRPPRDNEAVSWIRGLQSVKPIRLPGVGAVQMIVLHLFDREIPENP